MPDHIDHPVHYTRGIECIDYIISHKMNYMEGNIVKYVTRHRFKGGIDDLRKAEWYLKRLMKEEALHPAVEQKANDWPPVDECAKPLYLAEDMVAEDDARDRAEKEWDIKEYEKEKQREVAQETAQAVQEAHCSVCADHCDNYIKPHFPGRRY